MLNYQVNINEQFKSTEILFDGKPSEAVREKLKANGYRWHKVKGVWYGYKTPEELAEILNGSEEQADAVKAEIKAKTDEQKAKATPIKFYYNGIKINGNDDLLKCGYYINDNAVNIYADGYGSQLPRDLFDVKNDTDFYTDYFDEDHATVTPEHPLYKFVLYYAKKAEYMTDKRALKSWDNERNKRYYKPEKIAEEKAKLTAKIKAFEQLQDVGQPTNADLLKVDELNEQNARKKAEQKAKEEAEELKNYEEKKKHGELLLKNCMLNNPLSENAQDYVLIRWSEHPAFYSLDNSDGNLNLKLSIKCAEEVFYILDQKQNSEREFKKGVGYYDKTSFELYRNGEKVYDGRYDLGDGDGGLIKHIKAYIEWKATHTEFGHAKEREDYDEETKDFIKWLESFECEAVESLDSDSVDYQALLG